MSTVAESKVTADTQPLVIETGWQRLKRVFWSSEEFQMERSLSRVVVEVGFFTGFFCGGILSQRQARERFDAHAVGKSFGSATNLRRRRNDYLLVAFTKNGLRSGIRASFLMGGILISTMATTVYRDRFSLTYLPLYSAMTFSLSLLPVAGIAGVTQGIGFGLSSGLVLSALPFAASLISGISVDEGYRELRRNYVDRFSNPEREKAVNILMKNGGYWFRFMAEREYEEIQTKKKKKLKDKKTKNEAVQQKAAVPQGLDAIKEEELNDKKKNAVQQKAAEPHGLDVIKEDRGRCRGRPQSQ